MNNIILVLKGFIIGMGKIIPGVSGAIIAISLGIYEKAIESISYFFKNPKANLKFLIPIGIGVFLSVIIGSKIITYFITNHYFIVLLLFIGLILGSVPPFSKKIIKTKDYWYGIIPFILVLLLDLTTKQGHSLVLSESLISFLIIIGIGLIEAITMIIPGLSGTAIMILIGVYKPLLNVLGSILQKESLAYNIFFLIPYGLGIIIGVLLISKIVNHLFKNHRNKTNYMILGFSLAGVLLLLKIAIHIPHNINQIIIGIILMPVGFIISNKIESD